MEKQYLDYGCRCIQLVDVFSTNEGIQFLEVGSITLSQLGLGGESAGSMSAVMLLEEDGRFLQSLVLVTEYHHMKEALYSDD